MCSATITSRISGSMCAMPSGQSCVSEIIRLGKFSAGRGQWHPSYDQHNGKVRLWAREKQASPVLRYLLGCCSRDAQSEIRVSDGFHKIRHHSNQDRVQMIIKQYGRAINAGETTPLTMSSLAYYFGYGRSRISDDLRRGYCPEFGDRSTPAHYRAWMQANPKARRRTAAQSILERELARLS